MVAFGAYFQCHKDPLSTYICLESFRQFHPDASVVLVSDNGHDYSKLAEHFGCHYIHCNRNLVYIHRHMHDGSHIEHAMSLIERIVDALSRIKEEYFMWLEDDVVINSPIEQDMPHTINGYCPWSFNKNTIEALHIHYPFIIPSRIYRWSGHGGSIFNKRDILEVFANKKVVTDVLDNWQTYNLLPDELPQDYFFSLLVHLNKKTIGSYEGHADGVNNELDKNIPVQHQYKRFYGQSMPRELAHLVSEVD